MPELADVATEAPVLSPGQRVINLFAAPAKTFAAVRRSPGWWVPFLITVVVGLLYAYVLIHKVGEATVVNGMVHQSSKLEDSLAQATPEQAARLRSSLGATTRYAYVFPVLSFIFGLAGAGILLATANFGAGGNATFKQMLGVWFYGTLPLTVFTLLIVAAVYGGVTGDDFNIKNPIGTNAGFYVADSVPKMMVPVLSALDIFAVWSAVLLMIGVSTVAGIKRGAAAAVVFGWWIVFIVLQTVGAAFG